MAQPVITEIQRCDDLTAQVAQGMVHALDVRFHRHLPVVPFGEDIRQPNHRRPAPAEPPVLMVPGNLSVQDLDKAHLDHLPDEQSHIIYPFRDDHQIAWPRRSWTCCASCTLMMPSFPKIEPLGREHSTCIARSENTLDPNRREPSGN